MHGSISHRVRLFSTVLVLCWSFAPPAWGQEDGARSDASARTYSESLTLAQAETQSDQDPEMRTEQSSTETHDELNWDIDGPISLRSADPEPPGELVIKNIFGWSTSRGGDDDDFEYELEIEYGVMEDHELILQLPVEFGDARINGNADATLGWHWRLWKEEDGMPAFAMRNFIRVPSGVDSSGVDYKWVGLITKSVVPGEFRLHANPFIESVNGHNEEDARHFLWGSAFGFDYRCSDDLLLIADYRYETGEEEHTRDQHSLELGVDWTFADHQKLGMATTIGLDGDEQGPSLGARVSYIISF
ncbi:MAG: hypothetical protein V3T70_08790 [Phycisphaerae bacterium]